MIRQTLPSNRVCLTTNSQDSLNGDVHDHKTLSTEAIRQDLQSIGDEQTGPGESVEDAEDPDERDLCVAGAGVGLA